MKNIQQLIASVKDYLTQHNINTNSNDILSLIELNFIELDTLKFNGILSNYVVNPLAIEIDSLKHELSNISKSVSKRKLRKEVNNNIDTLNKLLHSIFNTHKPLLKDNKFFQEYNDRLKNKFLINEQAVLDGYFNEEPNASFIYPTYFDYDKIQNLSIVLEDHIKMLNSDKENFEFAKQKTNSLQNSIKDSIEVIQKNKSQIDKVYTIIESKLKVVSSEKVSEDEKTGAEFNKREYYTEMLIEYTLDKSNQSTHEEILKDLNNKLVKNYSYLNYSGLISVSNITVFGNSNFEAIKQLINALKIHGFISTHLETNDFIQVFTLDENNLKSKINLTNGTLNDFGFLLLQMKPYFTDSINTKSNYSLWWSERFTFNTKNKDKKAVSNMISAITREGYRQPQKKNAIKQIVEILRPIPQ
jgi:hypothetical protein